MGWVRNMPPWILDIIPLYGVKTDIASRQFLLLEALDMIDAILIFGIVSQYGQAANATSRLHIVFIAIRMIFFALKNNPFFPEKPTAMGAYQSFHLFVAISMEISVMIDFIRRVDHFLASETDETLWMEGLVSRFYVFAGYGLPAGSTCGQDVLGETQAFPCKVVAECVYGTASPHQR